MSGLFNLIVIFYVVYLRVHTSFSTVLLAHVTQDRSYRFFTISVYMNNYTQGLEPINLMLDISSPLSWVHANFSNNYNLIPCSSSLCNSVLRPHVCSKSCSPSTDLGGCSPINTCVIIIPRNYNKTMKMDVAVSDSFALPTTDGRNPGRLTTIKEFVFSCSHKRFAPKGTAGIAALGRSNFSLSAQASRMGSFPFPSPNVFVLCLSRSPSAPGVAFFGTRGPYYFLPQVDLSNFLKYTPLLSSNFGTSRRTSEYFIGITGIIVNDKPIQSSPSLITNYSRARLDSMTPYTMLHASIYKTFVEAFVNESYVLNLTTITRPVKPFDVCYKAEDVAETNVGPNVPVIDLKMGREDVWWRILGSNSMVRISTDGLDLWCLGFINGGMKLTPLIVIGGHQMVDNLLQFDVENNRLGFTSSVLLHNTMCANFNFTQNNTWFN